MGNDDRVTSLNPTLSTNSLLYEGIQRVYRNAIVGHLRRKLHEAYPGSYEERLHRTFASEWEYMVASARERRATGELETSISDCFDLLGVNHFYNIFAVEYAVLVPRPDASTTVAANADPGQRSGHDQQAKQVLLGWLKSIKSLRDPLSHPSDRDFPFADAFVLLDTARRVLVRLRLGDEARALQSLRDSLHPEPSNPLAVTPGDRPVFATANLIGSGRYLFWGALTLWGYTIPRLVNALRLHWETRDGEFRRVGAAQPPSAFGEAFGAIASKAFPPLYRFAWTSIGVAGFIGATLLIGEYLVDTYPETLYPETSYFGGLTGLLLFDAFLFACSTFGFLASTFSAMRRHELNELRALQLAYDSTRTMHLPYLEEHDRLWNDKENHLVLLCIVSGVLFLIPAFGMDQFRQAVAGRPGLLGIHDIKLVVRLWSVAALLAGGVFQIWGTTFLTTLVNDHFERERATLSVLRNVDRAGSAELAPATPR